MAGAEILVHADDVNEATRTLEAVKQGEDPGLEPKT
jgi:hypothetical protein